MSDQPYTVCFVCTGNLCRSPMAASVFRGYVADAGMSDRVAVESAGTGDWHAGEPAQPGTLRTLARHGYDGDRHRARMVDRDQFANADLLVALDRGHVRTLRAAGAAAERVRLLREFDPGSGADLDVPDPYGGPDEEFEYCFELIDAACPGLLEAVHDALTTNQSP